MDVHIRVVAVLHMIAGALGVLTVAVVSLFFGVVATLIPVHQFPFSLLLGFGAALALVFAALGLAEFVAGFMLLKGGSGAKTVCVLFGVLQLLNVPFGTAMGVYTLWALLRTEPAELGDNVRAQPQITQ